MAQVRTRTGVKLCDAELAFRKRRSVVAASGISSLLSRDGSNEVSVRPEHVPTIGIAASGGGCRAMVATLASLNELKSNGILDVTTYIAGVSGSTWALAQLYNHNNTANCTRWALQAAKLGLSKNMLNPLPLLENPPTIALATMIERLRTSNSKINLVDVFGILLSVAFLDSNQPVAAPAVVGSNLGLDVKSLGSYGLAPRISMQSGNGVEDGTAPLPIYSAVTFGGRPMTEKTRNLHPREKYQWVEFTPYEMGLISSVDHDDGIWIPMNAFGREFRGGVSRSDDLEVALGILLGVFGSAFTANLQRILQELQDDLPKEVVERARMLLKGRLDFHAINPALFPNPAYQLHNFNDSITESPYIPLMDSGMDNSMPFAPLLHPSRKVDILIVLDASADIGNHPFLQHAEQFANNRNITLNLPNLNLTTTYVPDGSTAGKNVQVVYIPLVGEAARAKYSKASNFLWTGVQVDTVADLAAGHVSKARDDIVELVRKVWIKKRDGGGGGE
ncbi:hypothetical protein HDU81_000561 [Chytriomyces hyalinus]|nr:hypothetical protein HDU81_000561 [Chytriomyces hyalinus]